MTEPFGWAALGAAVAATYVWRMAGILVASRIKPDSNLARWITAVAYAVLAGLIARMMILPEGALASAPVADKLAGLALGFTAYFVSGRSVPVGTATAFVIFTIITVARSMVGS
ncbi:MAG: AzlD domain-containing protein [Rhodospirillales bacterium]